MRFRPQAGPPDPLRRAGYPQTGRFGTYEPLLTTTRETPLTRHLLGLVLRAFSPIAIHVPDPKSGADAR